MGVMKGGKDMISSLAYEAQNTVYLNALLGSVRIRLAIVIYELDHLQPFLFRELSPFVT
jgi:hypothetical protein